MVLIALIFVSNPHYEVGTIPNVSDDASDLFPDQPAQHLCHGYDSKSIQLSYIGCVLFYMRIVQP